MRASLFSALLLVSSPLHAHTGEPLRPHDLWSTWKFDPGVVIPLLVTAVWYAVGSRRTTAISRWQWFYFWSGWVSLFTALVSPLHPLGESLFSAHMTQHEILILISAPLLVLSKPLAAFLWALPFEWRRSLGRWSKFAPVRRSWLWFTAPLTAWWVHAVAVWVWHAPVLFEATLESDLVHTAQHLSFFISALLFWWALFHAHGARAYGSGVLYIFTTAIHTGILGALLTFAPHIWYHSYANSTQPWGLSPLEDQQIGGLIMWVPASLVYLAAGLFLFAAWMKESDVLLERKVRAK
jgi:cytochrome c oxidase assembly factor CtaG